MNKYRSAKRVRGHKFIQVETQLERILRESLSKQIEGELRFLVTGKTGQGKSALINGVLGADVTPEGASASRCTTEVGMHSKVIKGVPVHVFDSPGLQDRTENEEEYIRKMREKCQKLSLVLYCTKMINTRLTSDDRNAMMKLTQAFGDEFWNYTILVLTFANMEDVTRKDDRDDDKPPEPHFKDKKAWKDLKRRRFKRRLQIWKENLQEFLINDVGVNPKIVKEIPVIPTGDRQQTINNEEPYRLPDRDDWFIDLWEACCRRVKETYLFLLVNRDRMRVAVTDHPLNDKSDAIAITELDLPDKQEEHADLDTDCLDQNPNEISLLEMLKLDAVSFEESEAELSPAQEQIKRVEDEDQEEILPEEQAMAMEQVEDENQKISKITERFTAPTNSLFFEPRETNNEESLTSKSQLLASSSTVNEMLPEKDRKQKENSTKAAEMSTAASNIIESHEMNSEDTQKVQPLDLEHRSRSSSLKKIKVLPLEEQEHEVPPAAPKPKHPTTIDLTIPIEHEELQQFIPKQMKEQSPPPSPILEQSPPPSPILDLTASQPIVGLTEHSIPIRPEFAKDIVEDTIRKGYGERVAERCRAVIDIVIRKPAQWLVGLLNKR